MLFLVFFDFVAFAQNVETSWATESSWCDNCTFDARVPVYNTTNCLNWSLIPLALRHSTWPTANISCISFNNSTLHFCPKIIYDPPELVIASCTTFDFDDVVPCILNTTRSNWYRGPKSTTAFGKHCLRWDTVSNLTKPFESFFAFETPLLNSISSGIHGHENFCRNPDNWGLGPWCYINSKGQREPCFQQCTGKFEANHPFCLSRRVFENDYFFENSDKEFYKAGLPLLHSATFAALREYTMPLAALFSTPDFCYVHDVRAKVFGPWMLAIDAEASTKEPISNLREDPWHRCFFACEDAALTCIPSNIFSYFGPKYITNEGHLCMAPSELRIHLMAMAALYPNLEALRKNEKHFFDLHQLFFEEELQLNDGSIGENGFYQSFAPILVNSECFNYGNLIQDVDFAMYSSLKSIAEIGVGCFVAQISTAKKLVSVTYEPCFKPCATDSKPPVFAVLPILPNWTYVEGDGTAKGDENEKHVPVVVTSENFKELLAKGSMWPAFATLSISVLAMIAAIIVCGLHAFDKI